MAAVRACMRHDMLKVARAQTARDPTKLPRNDLCEKTCRGGTVGFGGARPLRVLLLLLPVVAMPIVWDAGLGKYVAVKQSAKSPTPPPEEDPLEWSPDFGDEAAAARAFARVLDGDDGEVVELVVQVATPQHWHMYHGPTAEDMGPGIGTPTTVTVEGGNVDWEDDVHYPEPFRYVQDASDQEKGWLWAHEGLFHFALRGEAFDEYTAEGRKKRAKREAAPKEEEEELSEFELQRRKNMQRNHELLMAMGLA